MSNGWIKPTEDTALPDPADPLDVEWTLRYGDPERADLLWAAAVISAYKHLMEGSTS
jgi:hypothetical protein